MRLLFVFVSICGPSGYLRQDYSGFRLGFFKDYSDNTRPETALDKLTGMTENLDRHVDTHFGKAFLLKTVGTAVSALVFTFKYGQKGCKNAKD